MCRSWESQTHRCAPSDRSVCGWPWHAGRAPTRMASRAPLASLCRRRTTVPRPRPARIFWTPALLAATVALALGGCSGADADGGDGEPTAYGVPDVPVPLTAPAGRERGTRDGAFALA